VVSFGNSTEVNEVLYKNVCFHFILPNKKLCLDYFLDFVYSRDISQS